MQAAHSCTNVVQYTVNFYRSRHQYGINECASSGKGTGRGARATSRTQSCDHNITPASSKRPLLLHNHLCYKSNYRQWRPTSLTLTPPPEYITRSSYPGVAPPGMTLQIEKKTTHKISTAWTGVSIIAHGQTSYHPNNLQRTGSWSSTTQSKKDTKASAPNYSTHHASRATTSN
jgi:hypothetical protein